MSDDPKATPNPTDGGAAGDINVTTVPKAEFDKTVSGYKSELDSLRKSLEEAQGQFTDPNYLQFLAQKKSTSGKATSQETPSADNLTKELASRLENVERVSSQLAALLELQEIERKYSDFNDYRSEVQTLISSGGSNLNFEQAYLIAKQQKGGTKPANNSEETPPKGSEKPGKFIPTPDLTTREFKTTAEANKATLEELKSKYGVGDII